MRRFGLGRGLTALIPEATGEEAGASLEIPVDVVHPNPYQPRQHWPEETLAELSASIRQYGVLQPILVRPVEDGYQLVAGERRWRAAREAGLERIPAVVRELSDEEVLLLALVENLQREDINPIEAAQAYQRALQEFGLTQGELAGYVGRSRAAVANTLRLLGLEAEIRQSIADGRLSEGHGRALLAIGDGARRRAMWKRALEQELTVRQLEGLAQEAPGGRARSRSGRRRTDPHLQAMEDRLRRACGTDVDVRSASEGGWVCVRFYTSEDLEGLVELVEAGAARRVRSGSGG